METDLYPAPYVAFMAEAKGAYEEVCDRIAAGDAPAGAKVKVSITVPADVVDHIRVLLLEEAMEQD